MTCWTPGHSSTLSCTAQPLPGKSLHRPRRAPVQLTLNLSHDPDTCIWQRFDEDQRAAVLETLAGLIAKAAQYSEETDDE